MALNMVMVIMGCCQSLMGAYWTLRTALILTIKIIRRPKRSQSVSGQVRSHRKLRPRLDTWTKQLEKTLFNQWKLVALVIKASKLMVRLQRFRGISWYPNLSSCPQLIKPQLMKTVRFRHIKLGKLMI